MWMYVIRTTCGSTSIFKIDGVFWIYIFLQEGSEYSYPFPFFFHKRFFFVEGQTFKTRKKGGILHGYQFYLE